MNPLRSAPSTKHQALSTLLTLAAIAALALPCAALPIGLRLAARAAAVKAQTKPAYRLYVQDGLVAMWDGEWNTPDGHDPTATTWADLSGNGHDLTQSTGAVAWTDDALQLGKGGSLYGSGAAFDDIWSLAAQKTASTALTLEIVYHTDMDWTNGTIFVGTLTGQWANGCIGGVAVLDCADPVTRQKPANTFSNGAYSSPLVFGVGTRKTFFAAATYTYDESAGLFNTQTFADGAPYLASNVRQGSKWRASVGFGVLPSNYYTRFVGRIHCARVYRRALTAEEIAANHALDRRRFGATE